MKIAVESTGVRRFTIEEYYRMAEAGVIAPEERVELIEGIICKMSPEGSKHAVAIELARQILTARIADRAGLRFQHPVTLSDDTEPEPDIAIVKEPDPRAYLQGHPRSALLVIEVSETSSERDLGLKAAVYARAAIPEYWVENLVGDTLEVFRHPEQGIYRSRQTLRRGDKIFPVAFPDIEIKVAELLP